MAALKILLVDDDEDDVLLTSGTLQAIEGQEFEIDTAATLAEARVLIAAGRHDAYLVDYRLGESTGLDVALAILDAHPYAPVIMLSGTESRAIDVRATELGIADYLVKGQLEPRSLERSIRYAVTHQHALRELADSEQRYALAMAGANDGLWDWDLRTDALFLSARYKAMLGFDDEAGGAAEGPSWWLERIHPEERPQVEQAVREHLEGLTSTYEAEYRILGQDGAYRWVLSRGQAVRGPDGRPVRLAGSISDVTDRKLAVEQLQHDALHDALTGLPNRVLFVDRLEHVMRRRLRRAGAAAVLFLDLDRFKIVNDSLGHLVGDQLLVEVAARLQSALRPGDTVARLGGDEFTVLLEDLSDFEEAERVADRVLANLEAPFASHEREIYLSGSIGIAMIAPGATPEEVIRDADAAMYRAKTEGKGRHALFDSTLHEAAIARLELETRLRRGLAVAAIGDRGLQVAYQPIAHAADRRLHGFEALARWRDADGCVFTPDEFIPVAEETGLISALGRLVLREACRQLAEWHASEGDAALTMSVNISGHQLFEPAFAAQVEAALRDNALAPECLRLEITETAAAADADAVRSALHQLFEHTGVRAHLDDFGTGSASLTVLRGFPGDALKIDRSFVLSMGQDEGAFQIVKAVVGLAHEMGMSVVAEGVECGWQLDLLRRLDCEYAQGFYLARPLGAAAAGALLATGLVTAA